VSLPAFLFVQKWPCAFTGTWELPRLYSVLKSSSVYGAFLLPKQLYGDLGVSQGYRTFMEFFKLRRLYWEFLFYRRVILSALLAFTKLKLPKGIPFALLQKILLRRREFTVAKLAESRQTCFLELKP
jgi:hypothetical protein